MKAEHILSSMTPEQRSALTFDEYKEPIKAESVIFAKIRRLQVNAYVDEGFTPEQAIQLIAITRKQAL